MKNGIPRFIGQLHYLPGFRVFMPFWVIGIMPPCYLPSRYLSTAPEHRSMLYETAFASGFRAGELRSLTPAHIDEARGGLHL